MMQRLKNHKLKIALLLTLLVRIGILLAFGNSFFFYDQTGFIHGSSAYDEYALNLLETGVYGREVGVPDALISPLYSYLVAAVYGIFGRSGLAIGLLHTLLDCITVALVYDIARRLFKQGDFLGQPLGEWVGFGAAIFTACYPYLVFQNLTLIDTAIFMTLMYLFTWLIVLLREQETYNRKTFGIAVAGGVVLGLSALVRALLPIFALFVAVWFLMRLKFVQSVLRLLPVAIISLLVLVPWMIRSYQVYDDFVTVALNTGNNLWHGNNPMTVPLFRAGYDAQWSQSPEIEQGTDYEYNQRLTDYTINYMSENRDQLPELLWVKFWIHWSLDITPRKNPLPGQNFELAEDGSLIIVDDGGNPLQDIDTVAQYESGLLDRVARPLHVLYFTPLLILALLGLVMSARQWRDVSLIWFLQISMTIMYLIFHPSTRYRVPTDPLLFAFSAYALIVFVQMWLTRRNATAGMV